MCIYIAYIGIYGRNTSIRSYLRACVCLCLPLLRSIVHLSSNVSHQLACVLRALLFLHIPSRFVYVYGVHYTRQPSAHQAIGVSPVSQPAGGGSFPGFYSALRNCFGFGMTTLCRLLLLPLLLSVSRTLSWPEHLHDAHINFRLSAESGDWHIVWSCAKILIKVH